MVRNMNIKNLSKILLIFNLLININTQTSTCNNIQNPKSYGECSPYDSPKDSTLCCWIRGVYGGNNGTACLSVDTLFANRSISYTVNGQTGTMICGNQISHSSYINISVFVLILLSGILFI
jgi:hypothetical protein